MERTKERRNEQRNEGTKERWQQRNERKAANFERTNEQTNEGSELRRRRRRRTTNEERTNERTNERMNSEQRRNDTMTLPTNGGYAINFNFPSASAPTLKFQFSALLRRLKIAKMEKSEKSECASLRRSATPRTLTHSVSQVNRSFYEHGSYSKVVFHKDKGTPPTATDYI